MDVVNRFLSHADGKPFPGPSFGIVIPVHTHSQEAPTASTPTSREAPCEHVSVLCADGHAKVLRHGVHPFSPDSDQPRTGAVNWESLGDAHGIAGGARVVLWYASASVFVRLLRREVSPMTVVSNGLVKAVKGSIFDARPLSQLMAATPPELLEPEVEPMTALSTSGGGLETSGSAGHGMQDLLARAVAGAMRHMEITMPSVYLIGPMSPGGPGRESSPAEAPQDATSSQYTYYTARMVYNDGSAVVEWDVKRRYSEFRALRDSLAVLPAFARMDFPKKYFTPLSDERRDRRRELLGTFLGECAAAVPAVMESNVQSQRGARAVCELANFLELRSHLFTTEAFKRGLRTAADSDQDQGQEEAEDRGGGTSTTGAHRRGGASLSPPGASSSATSNPRSSAASDADTAAQQRAMDKLQTQIHTLRRSLKDLTNECDEAEAWWLMVGARTLWVSAVVGTVVGMYFTGRGLAWAYEEFVHERVTVRCIAQPMADALEKWEVPAAAVDAMATLSDGGGVDDLGVPGQLQLATTAPQGLPSSLAPAALLARRALAAIVAANPRRLAHATLGLLWVLWALLDGLKLLSRRSFVFSVFTVLMLRFFYAKQAAAHGDKEAWDRAYRVVAPLVYRMILSTRGLWVKAGQYISSRADVFPTPFIRCLSKLQDAVPPSPFALVKRTLESDLGKPLSEVFAHVEETALAAASIAQVHRAELLDGRQVVVKVQHRGIRPLVREDLGNGRRMAAIAHFLEPDYDFRPLVREFCKAVTCELDFRNEARSQQRAARAMARAAQAPWGIKAFVPKLHEELTSPRVLCMEYCHGFKITDEAALTDSGLSSKAIVMEVCRAFAYQMHVDGLFNGDPHPGNILVQKVDPAPAARGPGGDAGSSEFRLVLLDWGLAKTLDDRLRVAFARMSYSAATLDFGEMLCSFDEIGIKLNRFDPEEDMANTRFLFRDTMESDDAKKAVDTHITKYMKKRKEEQEAGGRKNHVEEYPSDLLFFLRTNDLLHGLATRMGLNISYVKLLKPFAKHALVASKLGPNGGASGDAVAVAARGGEDARPGPRINTMTMFDESQALVGLRDAVATTIERLLAAKQLLGCQVCVKRRGVRLLSCAVGFRGDLDHRLVDSNTLFCVFSVSKFIAATAVHRLLELHSDRVSLETSVASIWPGFDRGGGEQKRRITVDHVLNHTAGLRAVYPGKSRPQDFGDWSCVKAALEAAEPEWEPGTKCRYHALSFGWLVAAIVEHVSGKSFREFVRDHVSRDPHIQMGLPLPEDNADVWQNTAAISFPLFEHLAEAGLGLQSGAGDKKFADAMAGFTNTDQEAKVAEAIAREMKGKEHLLDLRIWNHPTMRSSLSPAANGHCSAEALCELMDKVVNGSLLSRDTVGRCIEARHQESRDGPGIAALIAADAGVHYGNGYQIFCKQRGQGHDGPGQEQEQEQERHENWCGFGHFGAAGSLTVGDLDSGISVAINVNQAAPDGGPASEILSAVCAGLRVEPLRFRLTTSGV